MQKRREVLTSFLAEMKELRTTLEGCDVFLEHSFIRSSLLFVYDAESNRTRVRMIDFPHTVRPVDAAGAPRRLDHRSPWEKGNHEDGYLTGVDNIIDIFEELLAAA